MIKIGITGGIGSGKTVVSTLLEIMGIPVYIADTESKRLTVESPQIRKQLTELLGEEIYQNDELNKPLLASYLFSHPDHAQKINAIIHPVVKQDFQKWSSCRTHLPAVAMEAAILIEAGFSNEVDQIVMVYAPLDVRIQRAMLRDSATQEDIIRRIQSQMNDEEKKAKANFIIVNDGTTPLIPQLERLLKQLQTA